jgi:hypothetical protein
VQKLDFFIRAYLRETKEMVFEARHKAFAFLRNTCTRGIYGKMKTAVENQVGLVRERFFTPICGSRAW